MHKATLVYSTALVRRAALYFWWRVTGVRYLVAFALVGVSLGALIRRGDGSWLIGVLASVLVLGIGASAALYLVHVRQSLQRLAAMGAPEAELVASEASFTVSSGAGTATIPWSSIIEVWRFESCWLLLLSRAQFITLPLADLSPDAVAFIRQRVSSAGGKLR